MTIALLPSHRSRAALAALGAAGAIVLVATPASAAPTAPPGFTVTQFAAGSGTLIKPDDIARLDGRIFVAFQNGVGPNGEPAKNGTTDSTIVEYSDSGAVLGRWNATGRVDGLAADPMKHLIYATVNEDSNSSFYVLNPSAAAPLQLRHLTYNDPNGAITGGTDAVSVDRFGNIYLSASNPAAPDSNVVAKATIDSPTVGQVTVAPTFPANAAGVNDGNNPGQTTTLAITDPDSNAIVPASSPRFAGQFVVDSQGDGQLIFGPLPLGTPTDPSTLTQLTLSVPGQTNGTNPTLDDVRWTNSSRGVLYVVDQGANIIYRVSGPFQAGQAFGSAPTDASNPPLQGDVVNVDLTNGQLSPFVTGLNSPKGLLHVGPTDRGLCGTESRQPVPGQPGTPYANCISGVARNLATICAGQSTRHAPGQSGTPFTNCVRDLFRNSNARTQ
ncbi:MAG: hypothetical protein ACR2KV_16915 [Solirubrobacteraceae bacterium]